MADKKAATVNLQGKEYATVPERLRIFREENPNGSIKTEPKFLEDGKLMFVATITKDASVQGGAEATGHALGDTKKQKDFEKLETIAVGRALALLGYLASGDIASSEEMTEFNEYKERQKEEAVLLAIEQINSATTVEELKETFMSLGTTIKFKEVQEAKDKRKAELMK